MILVFTNAGVLLPVTDMGKVDRVGEARALILLGTQGCHLCDKAETLLRQAASARALAWTYQDIALNDALVDKYGQHIPVLLLPDGQELNWPFSLLDILRTIG